MAFFDFLKRKDFEKKEAPQIVLNTTVSNYSRRDNYDSYASEGYSENAIVFRCINEIADGASAIPFKVFQGENELEEHPLISLLNRPNPMQAGVEYFKALYSYLLISGNSYMQTSVVSGQPRELYLLRPDRIRIKPSKTTNPTGYEYLINGVVVKTYDADSQTGESEVKHIKLFNPLDDYYGMSPIKASAIDIDGFNSITKHNLSLLENGARPSGAIVFKPQTDGGLPMQLSDSQRQQLQSDLHQRFQGSGNAGRPLLLEGDFDWREMGLSPKDMDFLQQKHMNAKDIALCFGVPSQLIGIPDSQTYANVQEARLALYEETIVPLAKRVMSDLNEWLAPKFGEDFSVQYDFEDVPAMTERRRKIYENVVQAVREGIISRNEARARLGLEPITGGDEVYIAANLFPLGSPEVAPAEGAEAEEDGKDAYGLKREIEKDIFTTEEEAESRATEIGCFGSHSHETDDGTIFMPCASHADYERLTGQTLETTGKQDPRYGQGRDVFETQPEAARRAEQIGCDGTHTVRGPDDTFYMPCSSHAIYLRVREEGKQEDDEDDKAESDIDTTPTAEMAENAQRGLDFREEFGRGGTRVGAIRARQLVARERLSPSVVRRMHSFFARHEVDKRAEGFRQGEDGYPSAGKIANLLWGGDAGQAWAKRTVEKLDKERDKQKHLEQFCLVEVLETEEKAPVSGKTKKTISNKVKEHNDKHGDKKGKRVTQRMLEAVFRRGVGAYRTNPESVRRSVMGPDQWGIARVNAFLYAVRTGRFRSGKFDLDLLPKGHRLRSKN
tara:strand:- start:3383 stop:5737 length:2355 start_codon:yes stop_codon:yes gene_type:complete